MYDSTFTPPPPAPELRKHSLLGIASFILAFVALLLVCGYFSFEYYLVNNATMASIQGISVIGWLLFCGFGISNLAGIGLGIAAVVQKAQSKVFGILGVVFNSLILLSFCTLIVLGMLLITAIYMAYAGG